MSTSQPSSFVRHTSTPPSRPAVSGNGGGPPVAATAPPAPEKAVQALEAELIACQRLAMLGNLTAMAAHEFNNLLTPIIARCEAALSIDEPAFLRKTVERALVQSQRAIGVARHLLGAAHETPTDFPSCSVRAAVDEAIETMTRPLEKDGIDLRIDVSDDLRVAAQPELFGQVVLNLLLNARKAMQGLRGSLAVAAKPADGAIELTVRDSGKGIAPERIADVFNPFLAAPPAAQPNDWQQVGLGLSVCRLIAHRHSARLWVTANEGPGCTFHVQWPAAVGSA